MSGFCCRWSCDVACVGSDASNQNLAQPTAATTGTSEEPNKKADIFPPGHVVDELFASCSASQSVLIHDMIPGRFT